MSLKTTTWKNRNIDNLELTRDFAISRGIKAPVVVNFGPGGSVTFLADSLPTGRTADLNSWYKFIRVFESFLRKTGLFRLKTNEPGEILRVFNPLKPKKIIVFDREPKVIEAVNRLGETGVINIPLEAGVHDLLSGPTGASGDIVVALNIISRTGDREKALQTITSAVVAGGLLCVNIDDAPEGFTKLGHCLFEKDRF